MKNLLAKDWILSRPLNSFLVKAVKELQPFRAQQLAVLFKEGCENAYIARYREDVHGGMAPDRIRRARNAFDDAIELNDKVHVTISLVVPKVVGDIEKEILKDRLKNAENVGDVYRIKHEYISGTTKTRVQLAREYGFERAAREILKGENINLRDFLSENVKTMTSAQDFLRHSLADLINNHPEVKKFATEIVRLGTMPADDFEWLKEKMKKEKKKFIDPKIEISWNLTRGAKASKDQLKENGIFQKYDRLFFECQGLGEQAARRGNRISDHTMSALIRGMKNGIFEWNVEFKMSDQIRISHPFYRSKVAGEMMITFKKALNYSINQLFPAMVRSETEKFLKKRCEDRSIYVFGKNVEQLFLQNGIRGKYVIALDPGSIVKAAFLDPEGKVLGMTDFYLHYYGFDDSGIQILEKWSQYTNGRPIVIAIGNGSHSYETQEAVSKILKHMEFSVDVRFCVVSEVGASKYSVTESAREEFGEDANIKHISAVSIGRRLLDPMAEYVKIPPQHLGKGQYQLDADEKELQRKLESVVRDRVSLNGVDLNLASRQLLQNIAGLNREKAEAIIRYREKKGRFCSREELKKVEGIDERTFQQCAGFLKVDYNGSSNWSPFDTTMVHPDDYDFAERLLQKLGMSIEDVANNNHSKFFLNAEESRILDLLKQKPELTAPPMLIKKVTKLNDLVKGSVFEGRVANSTDFGLFVDIGVSVNGLVHISEFPHKMKNEKPRNLDEADVPLIGDQIRVIIDKVYDTRENQKIDLILCKNQDVVE